MALQTAMGHIKGRFKEIYNFRNMIFSLVGRDLRGKYRNSSLGVLWYLMNPLFQIIIYFIVFSSMASFEMEAYYVFLTAGIIPWFFFSHSMSAGASCIVSQAGMIKKISFPREVIPITVVISNLVNFLIAYAIVFALIGVTGHGFNGIALLFLPVIVAIQFLFILGLVFLTSSLNVFYRDVSSIIGVLMMGMMWISPVIYRSYFGTELLQTILTYNPMTYFLNVFHDIMYSKIVPSMFDLGVCCLLALFAIILGWTVFAKLQHKFAEEL